MEKLRKEDAQKKLFAFHKKTEKKEKHTGLEQHDCE